LIPPQTGGTPVSGFNSGFSESVKRVCDFWEFSTERCKLSPEDVWMGLRLHYFSQN
jgi:Type IIA topoisomerase (DNA gyrase/topo II, topoisomerase IV), B subunit